MTLTPPESLRSSLARPVAVLGGGVSGEGVVSLLVAIGAEATMYDAAASRGAEFTATAARRHALAVFSPGFAPNHPWLERARAAGVECLAELDFASLFWRGRVLAVTGTNGKTTLTEFLTHALRGEGREAHATGNIGRPLSGLVAELRGGARDTWAICETSSFQAETFRHFQADATLWTNFAEDHLERHRSMEGYFAAKWKLVERTRPGATWIGSSVERHARAFERPVDRVHAVTTEALPADPRLEGTVFGAYPQRENFILAEAWWRSAGLPQETLLAAARSFRLGRHRCSRVATIDGIAFWNDSKATNFHAVEAALAGFEAPVVLIAGGRAKGGDLAGFVHRIAPRVKHAVLIGETAGELAFHCSAARMAHTTCADFPEAVRRARELAEPGEHVLLSPGFASFDLFRNYEDRGDQFEDLVRRLANPAALILSSFALFPTFNPILL